MYKIASRNTVVMLKNTLNELLFMLLYLLKFILNYLECYKNRVIARMSSYIFSWEDIQECTSSGSRLDFFSSHVK